MGFDCLKATESLRWGSLFFTTKFPEIPGTHLIDLGNMKGWVDLGATQWFWTHGTYSVNKKISKVRHFKEDINMASCSVGFIKKAEFITGVLII